MVDHPSYKLRKGDPRSPAQTLPGLAGITQQMIHFRRSKVPWVNLDVIPPIKTYSGESRFKKLTY
jgi:hypothetical protein